MEPAVRGARIEPTIIATRLETALFASQDSKFPNRLLSLETVPPGTEFLDAETGGQKSTRATGNVGRDQNSKIGVKNPRRNGLFLIGDGFRSSGRLDGGDGMVRTGCPPRSPIEPRLCHPP